MGTLLNEGAPSGLRKHSSIFLRNGLILVVTPFFHAHASYAPRPLEKPLPSLPERSLESSRRKSRAHSYTKPTGPWAGLAGCDITMYPAERAVSSGKMRKGAITRYEVVGSQKSQSYYSTNVRPRQEDTLGFFQQRDKIGT